MALFRRCDGYDLKKMEHKNTEPLQKVHEDKGRIEARRYIQYQDINWLRERYPDWNGLNNIGSVISIP